MTDLNKAKELAQRLRATTVFGFGHQAADTIDTLIMEAIEWRLPENNGAWERAENKRLKAEVERLTKGLDDANGVIVIRSEQLKTYKEREQTMGWNQS